MSPSKTFLFLVLLQLSQGATQNTFYGIIGGMDDDLALPYSAVVAEDGTLTQVFGGYFPSSGGGFISSVSINESGRALIGGSDFSMGIDPYAAFVNPGGQLQYIPFPISNMQIATVHINNPGNGLIGGRDLTTVAPYAATVDPLGNLSQFLPGVNGLPLMGQVYGVDLNDAGQGLIGGEDQSLIAGAFALYLSGGSVSPLSGGSLPTADGYISSVAINENGAGIIGGTNSVSGGAYAALVPTGGGTLQDLSGGSFPSDGNIYFVAINDAGYGIIGGNNDATNSGYAALIVPNSTILLDLTNADFPSIGEIYSVAINQAGQAIIGGHNDFLSYAAFAYPDGTLQTIPGVFPMGTINSVAISEEGVALIVGEGPGPAFGAIVAPNGAITPLSGGNFPTVVGRIISCAVAFDELIPAAIPTLLAPMDSFFAAAETQEYHTMIHHKKIWKEEKAPGDRSQIGLVAQSDFGSKIIGSASSCPDRSFDLWIAPFYTLIHQSSDASIPSSQSQIAGALASLDYLPNESVTLGGSLAYMFDYTHFSSSFGHLKVNQGIAGYFTSFLSDYVFINATLWGGYYDLHNERHTLADITSESHFNGWLFAPHFEISFAPYLSYTSRLFEGFFRTDWINNWQQSYTEKGSSGLNLDVGSLHASLLRCEAGFRAYQSFSFDWGRLLLTEKASYINRKPFGFNPTDVFFVGSISSFLVETGRNRVEDLGSLLFNMTFVPTCNFYPYLQLDFEGQIGPTYNSATANIEFGKYF